MRSAAARSSRMMANGLVLAFALIALVLALPASAGKPEGVKLTTVSPGDGQTVSGHVKWEVAVTGASPNRIEFSVDGALLWTETGAPYVFNGDAGTLDTTTLSNGWHTLTATAYGPKAQTSIRVLVDNTSTTPSLQVSTVTPGDGQTLSGHAKWEVGVSGGTPSKVDFLIDGSLQWTETAAPWVFNGDAGTLDTTTLVDGTHTLKAIAYTSSTSQATSVTVTVANSAGFTTNVKDGATIATPFGWKFDPGEPAAKGYFWADGKLLATVDGPGPYSWTLPSGLLADGSHTLGHSWDTTSGVRKQPASTYTVSISNGVQASTLGSALPARLPQSSGKGGTYYVDGAKGSDSNNGGSTAPWKTINKALATVPLAGSIIKIRAGTYYSSGTTYVITFKRAASMTDPITLEAETPGAVVIANAQPGQATIGGWIVNASGLRIRGLVFRLGYVENSNKSANLLLIQNSDRIEVSGSTFYESPEQGVAVRGGANDGDTADDVWILGNVFRSSSSNVYAKVTGMNFGPDTYYGSKGSHWIYAGQYGTNSSWELNNGTRRLVIANNVFTGSAAGRHVQLGPQARYSFVVNNTFFGNRAISVIGETTGARYAGGGVEFFANASSDAYKTGYNVVTNNVFAGLEGHGAYGSGKAEPGNLVQNNLAFGLKNGMGYQGSTSADYLNTYGSVCCLFSTAAGNRASADPRFANATSFDFRLGTSSPAIGAADPAYSFPFDLTGKMRDSSPDLGALES